VIDPFGRGIGLEQLVAAFADRYQRVAGAAQRLLVLGCNSLSGGNGIVSQFPDIFLEDMRSGPRLIHLPGSAQRDQRGCGFQLKGVRFYALPLACRQRFAGVSALPNGIGSAIDRGHHHLIDADVQRQIRWFGRGLLRGAGAQPDHDQRDDHRHRKCRRHFLLSTEFDFHPAPLVGLICARTFPLSELLAAYFTVSRGSAVLGVTGLCDDDHTQGMIPVSTVK
jgi:hypothetical protein